MNPFYHFLYSILLKLRKQNEQNKKNIYIFFCDNRKVRSFPFQYSNLINFKHSAISILPLNPSPHIIWPCTRISIWGRGSGSEIQYKWLITFPNDVAQSLSHNATCPIRWSDTKYGLFSSKEPLPAESRTLSLSLQIYGFLHLFKPSKPILPQNPLPWNHPTIPSPQFLLTLPQKSHHFPQTLCKIRSFSTPGR